MFFMHANGNIMWRKEGRNGEVKVHEDDWFAGKTLKNMKSQKEGMRQLFEESMIKNITEFRESPAN